MQSHIGQIPAAVPGTVVVGTSTTLPRDGVVAFGQQRRSLPLHPQAFIVVGTSCNGSGVSGPANRYQAAELGAAGSQSATAASILNEEEAETIEPTEEDVLYGRGKGFMYHSGNLRLQELVQENFERFEDSRIESKKQVSWSVVRKVQAEGGRFLKFDSEREVWTVVSDDNARKKVSHAMRDLRQRRLIETGAKEKKPRRKPWKKKRKGLNPALHPHERKNTTQAAIDVEDPTPTQVQSPVQPEIQSPEQSNFLRLVRLPQARQETVPVVPVPAVPLSTDVGLSVEEPPVDVNNISPVEPLLPFTPQFPSGNASERLEQRRQELLHLQQIRQVEEEARVLQQIYETRRTILIGRYQDALRRNFRP